MGSDSRSSAAVRDARAGASRRRKTRLAHGRRRIAVPGGNDPESASALPRVRCQERRHPPRGGSVRARHERGHPHRPRNRGHHRRPSVAARHHVPRTTLRHQARCRSDWSAVVSPGGSCKSGSPTGPETPAFLERGGRFPAE